MVTDTARYRSWKAKSHAEEHLSLEQKYTILQGLYEEARHLGWFDEKDALLGLDADIRLAAVLNANVSNPPR